MYRRCVYLPLILLVVSLACSQIPGRVPISTLTQEPLLSETMIIPPPTEPPIGTSSVIPTATAMPQEIAPTATVQTTDDLGPESGQIYFEESPTALYNLQSGSPVSMSNIFHPELGCSWMGVGGQVFGESGQPVGMLMVELGGSLNGEIVEGFTLTGSASQWGPGGYEFQIDDTLTASQSELWIRVLNLDGIPLSDRVYFETFEDCERSAILVNFIHHEAVILEQIYFPLIIQGLALP
jgi:hypothetical protein